MAKAADQFRQSDVTLWGMIALVCGAVAILSANVSALVPDSILAGLHASRLEGANLNQLRDEVANIADAAARLRAENTSLATRFGFVEKADGEVTRRVGALEISVPKLLEALPQGSEIDRSTVTGAIGTTPPAAVHYDTDGGSVSVTQQPLAPVVVNTDSSVIQPLPAMPMAAQQSPAADPNAFGVAIGPTVPPDGARSAWQDLSLKLGPLLLGLAPLLRDDGAVGGVKQIVVGPVVDMSEAQALCKNVDRVGIACVPVPYTGATLPN